MASNQEIGPPITVPVDHLVIPHNQAAQASLAKFLPRGIVTANSPDIEAIVDADKEAIFRGGFLARYCPKSSRQRRRADFYDAAGKAPWNPPTTFYDKRTNLDTNENVIDVAGLEQLSLRLIDKLTRLKRIFAGRKPITLLDYYDASSTRGCFTTPMLRQTLRTVLGDYYDEFVNDDLRANFRSGEAPMINRTEPYLRRFDLATAQGAIVIAGGTFSDADDVHGQWFQKNIMTRILDNPGIRALLVCWSYQVMARSMQRNRDQDFFVLNGALKFGLFPVDILGEGPLRKMFNEAARGQRLTAAFTHSDHLVPASSTLRLGDKIVSGDRSQILRVFAIDPLTKQVCGYMTDDKRIIGIAFHPEVSMIPDPRTLNEVHPHIETIQEFVRSAAVQTFLRGRYDPLSLDAVPNNFWPLNAKGQRIVKKNPGPAFYAAMLDSFASALLEEFDSRKRG